MGKLRLLAAVSNSALQVDGNSIVYSKGRNSTTIPISNIQQIRLEEPRGLKNGILTIKTGAGSNVYARVGTFAIGMGSEIQIGFDRSQLETAKEIRQYITNFDPSAPSSRLSDGSVDTDALTKLKSLFETGILTEAEYREKRRKILGF